MKSILIKRIIFQFNPKNLQQILNYILIKYFIKIHLSSYNQIKIKQR